jgi:surface antigen
MVWGGGRTGAGHVAVVEKIENESGNTAILVSESGYKHYVFKASVWLYKSNGYNYGGMPFKGFIL